MSDATTRPLLLDASEAPASVGDLESSLIPSETLSAKNEASGDREGKADGKQKRKRTSPIDAATLEAEYNLNPKPNKAARAEIVEKVDLNEKEVQIWFQNRRQIQRRKQRPLLPHEIAAFGLGNLSCLSADPSSTSIFSSSQSIESSATSQEDVLNSLQGDAVESRESQEPVVPKHSHDLIRRTNGELVTDGNSLPSFRPSSQQEPCVGLSTAETSSLPSEPVFKSFSSTSGYLANRWNTASGLSSTPAPTQVTQVVTPAIFNPIHLSSCPERFGFSGRTAPHSVIRLSMSLNGKAELISNETSPPRVQNTWPIPSSGSALPQGRMRRLQRSRSAVAFAPLPPISAAIPFPPHLPRGRSRDARSWQFACITEGRDELTTQAENESNGSAVAAISLLRSTSKSVSEPSNSKRSAPAKKHKTGAHGKKPKLERAQSSLAKLQSTERDSTLQLSKGKLDLMHSPLGDSDKENWTPHGEGGNARRRPLPSGRSDKPQYSKPVLSNNLKPPQRSAHVRGDRTRRQNAASAAPKIFEDQGYSKEVGEEVEKFMLGEVSPSKRGEFEGAQALLAMMGSWR